MSKERREAINEKYKEIGNFIVTGMQKVKELEGELGAELSRLQAEVEAIEREEFDGMTRWEVTDMTGVDPITGMTPAQITQTLRRRMMYVNRRN
jgi:predicted mannosyl-3-phosphoglycerate phosphatase (HAD superfamily)